MPVNKIFTLFCTSLYLQIPNRGRIRAHKIGGRVLFCDSDVEAALHRIVPIKSR